MVYSKHSVAEKFGVSTKTIERAVNDGSLPFHRIGSRILFDDDDIKTFWDKCKSQSKKTMASVEVIR